MQKRYSRADRVTLAPMPNIMALADASHFHQALVAFNVTRGAELSWDELTASEQSEVRRMAAQFAKQDHPCL